MLQTRLDFDLAHEAVRQLRLLFQIRQQNLHGFDAVGNHIADFEYLAHAAGAQGRNNFVIADSVPDLQAHIRLSACCARHRRL